MKSGNSVLPPARRPRAGERPAAWSDPPAGLAARSGEAHLWLLELPGLEALRDRLASFLDESERDRAGRFRFERDRDRFRLCRAAVRVLLGRYLGRGPADLRFAYGPRGKPFLSGGDRDERLEFNLAHSGDLGLLGISLGGRIGVDIERVDLERAGMDIAERFFSPEEIRALAAIPDERRTDAFFCCWVRKEAYLKARGDGLSLPLAGFTVTVDPSLDPALLRSDLGKEELSRWSLRDVPTVPGYAGAVAFEGEDVRFSFWRFPPGLLVGF